MYNANILKRKEAAAAAARPLRPSDRLFRGRGRSRVLPLPLPLLLLLLPPLLQQFCCVATTVCIIYTYIYYILYTSDFHSRIPRPPLGHAHWPNVLNITRCRSLPPPSRWPDELLSAIFRAGRVFSLYALTLYCHCRCRSRYAFLVDFRFSPVIYKSIIFRSFVIVVVFLEFPRNRVHRRTILHPFLERPSTTHPQPLQPTSTQSTPLEDSLTPRAPLQRPATITRCGGARRRHSCSATYWESTETFIINFALYLHSAIAIDPVFVCNVRAHRQQAYYVMTLMHILIHRIHRATLLKTHAHCDYTVFRWVHNNIKYSHSECIYYYYYYNAYTIIRVSLTRVLHSIALITTKKKTQKY